ncbi:MAG TPA: sulfite exporter TauE/SafE family protein [Solirubrobacterales bacterium]|nr:sulfite exporter TauE/SafE family protein [Solirubrobacterales bacterium]
MSPVEIAILLVWSFSVSLAGGMVGLVLGNLRLPVVVWLGSSAAAAAGANVAISGLAALTATIVHIRNGRLDPKLFLWMAPSSFAGAVAGGLLAGVLPERMLLGAISLIVLYGAVEVWRYRRPKDSDSGDQPDRSRLLTEAVLIGFGVGLLGGFVGLILGSLRLPAMLKYMGMSPARAVGTNSAVGVVVGAGGLIGHLPSGVDWDILLIGAATAIPGAAFGARLTGRLPETTLVRVMAAVLLISGLTMAGQAII